MGIIRGLPGRRSNHQLVAIDGSHIEPSIPVLFQDGAHNLISPAQLQEILQGIAIQIRQRVR